MSSSNSGPENPNSRRPGLPRPSPNVMDIFDYGEESVSVAMEEIKPQDWAAEVYKPDIIGHSETLYKKPGYKM